MSAMKLSSVRSIYYRLISVVMPSRGLKLSQRLSSGAVEGSIAVVLSSCSATSKAEDSHLISALPSPFCDCCNGTKMRELVRDVAHYKA